MLAAAPSFICYGFIAKLATCQVPPLKQSTSKRQRGARALAKTKRDREEPAGTSTEAESRAPAVNRAIGVLRLLADGKALGVNAIARAMGIVPSTCYHILRALEAENFVVFDELDKRYRIGLGIVNVAREAINDPLSSRFVQRELDRLASGFQVTTTLVLFEGRKEKVLIAASQNAKSFGIRVNVGYRMPAFTSASGRCLAAYSDLSSNELRKEFEALNWETPPTFSTWLAEIDAVRINGYGADRSNWLRGFTILAVPVFDSNRLTRAVAGIFAEGQLTESQQAALVAELHEVGRRLSTQ